MTTTTPSEDKIDLLINKISLLEGALKEERKNRLMAEEELSQYKSITVPNLKNQIEDKENLLKTTFIEKIKLEKDLLAKEKNGKVKNDDISILCVNDKENNMYLNKLEYMENAYKTLRKKFNDLSDEKIKAEQSLNQKIEIEKEKNAIIKKDCEAIEKDKQKLFSELRTTFQANKNLLVEIKSLNNLIEDINRQKEGYLLELNFYKKEYEFNKQLLQDSMARMRKVDQDYILITKTLQEYKTKISDMDTNTYIFSVHSIGRVIENYAELIFNKEGKGLYVLNIKHMTSSSKHDILDIEEITQKDLEEDMILLKFKPEKNLRDEKFRTKEAQAIMKVLKEFQTKAYQNLDIKKAKREEKKKTKKVEKNVENILSLFG